MTLVRVSLAIVALAALAVWLAAQPLLQQAPALLKQQTGQVAEVPPLERAQAAQKATEDALEGFKVAVEEGTREEAEAALQDIARQKVEVEAALQEANQSPGYNPVAQVYTDISLTLDWAKRVFHGRFGN